MSVRYVKRLQMIFDFRRTPMPPSPIELPNGFRTVPWDPSLLYAHAVVKYQGFRNDSDADVFPTFKQFDRCLSLMESITSNDSFVPEATLLISLGSPPIAGEYVANIQGMRLSRETGAIQNVAVVPDFRRQGLGRALVLGALHAFRSIGVQQVSLDVTADNNPAMRLYERIGFRTVRVHFKETVIDDGLPFRRYSGEHWHIDTSPWHGLTR